MLKFRELLKATGGRSMALAIGSQTMVFRPIAGIRDVVIKGISIDTRTIKKDEAFVAIKGGNFDGHSFILEAIKKGASCIISKACGLRLAAKEVAWIEVEDTQKALADIARFNRNKFNIPVIAITGSVGKTTTKEMVAWVLSARFNLLKNEGTKNNQIGLPQALLNLEARQKIAVLEIGSNHFGEVDYLAKICQPNIAVITNIGPAHLAYFGSLKGVYREKGTLLDNLVKPYLAILNADDAFLKKELNKPDQKRFSIGFGIKNKADYAVSDIIHLKEGLEFFVNKRERFSLKTLGFHNIYNALAAVAVARLFGLSYAEISLRLSDFDFPKSRFNFMRLKNIPFIDDTYNSNPFSLSQALNTLALLKIKGRKILVMGDMLELGRQEVSFHRKIGSELARTCDCLITVGKLSALAASCAKKSGMTARNIFTCESPAQARTLLFEKILPNEDDIVLVKGSRLMKMEEIFNAL